MYALWHFMKPVMVDIRCEMFELESVFDLSSAKLQLADMRGYQRVFDRVRTHHIIKYTSEVSQHKIYLYAENINVVS